jgi:Tfp pilus assembly protein PilF
LLDILRGAIQSFSRKPKKLMVNSPYLNGSIEGTEFVFRVTDEQTEITVFEGTVVASNSQGESSVTAGESVVAQQGQAPTKRILVNPRNEVTWGLNYPSILISGERSADPQVIEIAMLLESGRVNQAREKLAPLMASDNGLAYALSSVINIALNETAQALEDGARAVDLAPSAPSFIALSYAQQSNLDLESARATLQQANEANPDNALVLARLAELNLMMGSRSEAVDLAQRAVSINSELDNPQVVLGFAALALNDHATAGTAFETAISLNSSNPLSHLGLGLSKISAGDLVAGRKDIEAAVALDSNDAILRSYLGKSYFEEKRSNLAEDQYDIAKSLDPNDPTAFLYSGIQKQTDNRPVEALNDIEQSIELNDNRAVYRSRFLLDQDRAARGTSIARAYSDLGFNKLATNEASESLMLDPSNASAHRFLSDSYKAGGRTEIGRVSELFQAQMLQDVNLTPIQPSLAGSNLNLVTLGGPAQTGFNEFTPLFQRNQSQLDTSFQSGSNDLAAGEVVYTGVYDNFSISAGVMSYDNDGWRDNNDVEQDLGNIFIQYAVNDKFSIQAEYFERETHQGDLAFNFSEDSQFYNFFIDTEQSFSRIGAKYKPSIESTFLVSYIENSLEEDTVQGFEPQRLVPGPDPLPGPTPNPITDIVGVASPDTDGDQLEIQYIFDTTNYNIIVGASDVENDITEEASITFTSSDGVTPVLAPLLFGDIAAYGTTSYSPSPISESRDQEQSHAYLYYNRSFSRDLDITIGVSRDEYEDENFDVSENYPKFGLTWGFTDNAQLRLAAFETFKPLLANNRTLEPSQIAGFNQFFDDFDGTESSRTGIGLDFVLSTGMHISAEFTERDLDVPFFNATADETQFEDREESMHKISLYYIVAKNWSIVAELLYDKYESEEGFFTVGSQTPVSVTTQTIPLTVNYFNPNGFFTSIKGSYVDQEVDRSDLDQSDPTLTTPLATPLENQGEEDFFVVDLVAGYRLPKRQGVVSVGVLNVFDEDFLFQDDSYRERSVAVTSPYFPERVIVGQLTLHF